MRVGVIGGGWVGKAMMSIFPDAILYDPALGFTDEAAFDTDVQFICVPTPNLDDGSLDTSIVEEVAARCNGLIVIRSTVQPGTSDRIAATGKRVVMQPEYLGETVSHPLFNESERPFLILGGDPHDRRQLIQLYQTIYNANIRIRQVTRLEAEVIKLSENRAIAFKVMQCQELYDACEAAGVDYYTIRDAVYGDDPRFDLWFSFIYPEKRGFNSSKCLKKDVPGWAFWAKGAGINPYLTQSLIDRSDKYEKDSTN